ncbi:MAG: sporulation integral membrane protein YtvI [Thermoanaerobacteraceae bacterium]|nr:sporulation integral membrane protein YtvI [Thermoanaerobacteraceae bacterium]
MPKSLRVALLITTILLFYLAWKYVVPEVLHVLHFLLVVLTPFIMAVIIAVLMEPLVRFLNYRCRLNRSFAVAVSMLVFIGGIGALLAFLSLHLAGELSDLSVRLPQYMGLWQDSINQLVERGRFFYFQLPPVVTERIQENMGSITGWLSRTAGSLAGSLLHMVTSLPNAVTAIVVALVATFFVSRDHPLIVQLWLKTVPPPWGGRVVEVSREVMGASLGYLRAQSFLVTLTTLQSIIGLYLIGAKYSLTIGLLIGFFDIIPVLGPATVYVPWAIWCLFTGNIGFGIKLLLLYLLVWGVRQVLEARVVAANLGLHPLPVLVAMYTGLKLVGVIGLVLGPLTLIALLAVMKTRTPVNPGK